MNATTHLSLLRELQEPALRQAAWEKFHSLYHPVITRWARRRGLQDADCEDVAQCVLLRMHKALPDYDQSRGNFRSWLKTIVQNAVTDLLRSRGHKPDTVGIGGSDFLEKLANLESPDSMADLSTSLVETAPTDRLLKQAIEAVKSDARNERSWQAFELLFFRERPAKEVATELDMSVAAVYQAKYRILKAIRAGYSLILSQG